MVDNYSCFSCFFFSLSFRITSVSILFICFIEEERKRELICSSFVLILRPKIYGEKLTFVSATIPFIRVFFFDVVVFFFIYPFYPPSLTRSLSLSLSIQTPESIVKNATNAYCTHRFFYCSIHECLCCCCFFPFVREYNDQQTERSWCVSGTNLNLFRLVDGIDFQFKPIFQVHAWILNAYRHHRPAQCHLDNRCKIHFSRQFTHPHHLKQQDNAMERHTKCSNTTNPQRKCSTFDVLTHRKLSMQTVIAIGFGLFNCIIILSEWKTKQSSTPILSIMYVFWKQLTNLSHILDGHVIHHRIQHHWNALHTFIHILHGVSQSNTWHKSFDGCDQINFESLEFIKVYQVEMNRSWLGQQHSYMQISFYSCALHFCGKCMQIEFLLNSRKKRTSEIARLVFLMWVQVLDLFVAET